MCFVIRCKYLICHHLIDVHLYKFFTCLDINKTCLNQDLTDADGSDMLSKHPKTASKNNNKIETTINNALNTECNGPTGYLLYMLNRPCNLVKFIGMVLEYIYNRLDRHSSEDAIVDILKVMNLVDAICISQ